LTLATVSIHTGRYVSSAQQVETQISQAAGDGVPCLAGGHCGRFARRTDQGMVRRDVKPAEAAGFLIATLEGYVALAKNAQDAKVMKAGIRNIVDWLRSLRPPGNRRSG
jgi:hypothetical protein